MADIPEDLLQEMEEDPEARKLFLESLPTPHRVAFESAIHKRATGPSRTGGIPSEVEAIARGGAEGLTYGHSAEMAGVAKASDMAVPQFAMALAQGPAGVGSYLGNKIGTALGSDDEFVDKYRAGRDEYDAENQESREKHPYLYGGSEIAAGLMAPGGSVVKGAKGVKALKSAAKVGLGGGLLAGSGYSDADLTEEGLPAYALDVGVGGGLGLGAGVAAHGLAKGAQATWDGVKWVANKVGGKLDEVANTQAVRATHGLDQSTLEQLGPEGVQELGDTVFEEGLLKKRDLLTGGTSPKTLAKRTGAAQKSALDELTAVKGTADEAGVTVSREDFAKRIESDIIPEFKKYEANDDLVAGLEKEVTKIRGRAATEPELPVSEFEGLKRAYQTRGYEDGNQIAKHVGRAAKTETEQTILKKQPELYKKFTAAKERYENLKPVEKMAAKGEARDVKNRFLSLSDYLTMIAQVGAATGAGAGIGGATDSSVIGLASAVGINQLLRKRGPAASAIIVKTLAGALKNKSPQVQAVAATMAENPSKLGQFLEDLMNAAARSEEEFLQMHAVLAKDKEYRRKTRKAEKYYKNQ